LSLEEVKQILKNLGYNAQQSPVNSYQNQIVIPTKKDLNYYLQVISQYYNLDPSEIK
jgi:hypothetical protein